MYSPIMFIDGVAMTTRLIRNVIQFLSVLFVCITHKMHVEIAN